MQLTDLSTTSIDEEGSKGLEHVEGSGPPNLTDQLTTLLKNQSSTTIRLPMLIRIIFRLELYCDFDYITTRITIRIILKLGLYYL